MMFSDVEGSTALLKRLGTDWGVALSAQRTIIREAIAAHDGIEMGTEGDSFFVVFKSAQHALGMSVAAQRRLCQYQWPRSEQLRVRMGLHTGEPQRHENGYIGADVHRAARIASTASGGQVVLSETTVALCGYGALNVSVRDLGLHRLKDLEQSEHLFDLVGPGLPDGFPPVRSLGTPASLPPYATELVGREDELDELAGIVGSGARLVTLVGPGGTGKTRLAVELARRMHAVAAPSTYFIPLHNADRPALMWAGIAEALSGSAAADTAPKDRVLSSLAGRDALLVLDNVEQIEHGDSVVVALLDALPGLRLLATSRRPLHLIAEHSYLVNPLPLPTRTAVTAQQAGHAPAVELFVRRARMADPHFALTDANTEDVVGLCRALDGLPLALELSAARCRLLGPRVILRRLANADTLVGGADRVDRHRTLTATVRWSYELLMVEHRDMLRRLSAFAGPAELAAVEAIAAVSGSGDPLDAVAHLVDVSLVQTVEGPDGDPEVSLLETIRRFVRDRLAESSEEDHVLMAHARWFLGAAEGIAGLLHTPNQMRALDRMERVEADIRAALDWCLAPAPGGSPERRALGYAFLPPMNGYWYRFGYVAEARGWHERALTALDSEGAEDSTQLVDALHGMGVSLLLQNDVSAAERLLTRALQVAERIGDRDREARECNSLGVAKREGLDMAAARRLTERSASLALELGNPRRHATALANMVIRLLDVGDYPGAVEAARRAAAADEALGDPWGVAINQCNLALALLNTEGPERAYRHLSQVADNVVAQADAELTINLVEVFAAILAAASNPVGAACLLGAADNQRDVVGMPRSPVDQAQLGRLLGRVRHAWTPMRGHRPTRRGSPSPLSGRSRWHGKRGRSRCQARRRYSRKLTKRASGMAQEIRSGSPVEGTHDEDRDAARRAVSTGTLNVKLIGSLQSGGLTYPSAPEGGPVPRGSSSASVCVTTSTEAPPAAAPSRPCRRRYCEHSGCAVRGRHR
jgi:predicted ATPase/class 3 adenylate cyclase